MRTIRLLLVAVCLAPVVVSLAAPASAQESPRRPRSPGGEPAPTTLWVPGMNLEPATPQPAPTAPPEQQPATAGGSASTPGASPTAAPTPVPTPGPKAEPTAAPEPVRKASSGGLGLVPLFSVLGLALVTGPILLIGRRRRRRPDSPSTEPLVAGREPEAEPEAESEWAPEPMPEPKMEWEPEPMPEPELEWESEPIPEPAPVATLVEGAEDATPPPPNAIVCENCGRENPAEFLFCDNCAQLLKWSEA